jgi:uncharacterized OsmC-like protein
MRAAVLGITLDTLEVSVDSESDDRGHARHGRRRAVRPAVRRVRVRLTADGVDPATLNEVARWGVEHCPVCDALERPVPLTVEVATN